MPTCQLFFDSKGIGIPKPLFLFIKETANMPSKPACIKIGEDNITIIGYNRSVS